MDITNLLFTALVRTKSSPLHSLLASRLLIHAVKAIPFHSIFAEEKHENTPPVCIAGHFAASIPITFYDFLLAGMYLTADRWADDVLDVVRVQI
jgi:hypothetical protein